MKPRRRFQSILVALLFVALSTGLTLAQDQQAAPPASYPDQQQSYPDQTGQQPAYPDTNQQQYPNHSGQQPYPNQSGAQQQPYPGQAGQQQQQDPPGRVARVQYMSGEVSMQPGGVNDWIAASMNRPLTSADRVWTDKNSKAELNVGDGFLRMNSETSLTLTQVSDNAVQLELDQGTLSVTVKHLEKGEIYEVDTPNYAFTIMKPGAYRFDAYPNEDQSWVTVRSGYGEATGKGAAVRVNSGQQVRFRSGNSLVHTAENAPPRDGFDDWVQVRDKRLDDSLSARYVSPGVIGYQDLDGYGRWVPTPDYGNVWIPTTVPAGWAPYRFGHWVWIAPWGWTWVDDQPWGFAPFHYGRWVSWGGYWGWAPGPIGYWNPYYAPALVGWIGGPGFGVGFGFGGGGWGIGINFGWFPLGWGEPFYPRYCGWGWGGWYHGGGYVTNAYFRNVNITNTHITNINNYSNSYRNGNFENAHYGFRNTPGAVTAAPRTAFTSGAAINRVGGAVPASALGRGSMISGVNATPSRASALAGSSPARSVPPSSAFGRSVATRATASNAARPANLEAANQATAARGNMNSFGRGGSTTASVPNNAANNGARPGMSSPASNGHVNSPTGTQANSAAHGPTTNGTEARLSAPTPTSKGGNYVPRPPSAGGMATSGTHSMNGSAAGNSGNFGHTTSNPASVANNRGSAPTTNANQGYNNGSHPSGSYNSNRVGSQPSHGSSPQSSAPHSNYSGGPSGALSVPRPPANYSYHASPTYSASANYGAASRANGGYYGNRNYSAPSSNAGRSYGSTPNSSAGRGYGSSPSYSNRSYGSSPSYSNRSYGSSPSYSARNYGGSPSSSHGSASTPRYSGGSSGGYHGGAGSSHSSGGGGGHSGGGGHR